MTTTEMKETDPGPHTFGGNRHLIEIEAGFLHVMIGLDITGNGTVETPRRAAEALMEMTAGYTIDVPSLFKTFDKEGENEMVIERDIAFTSLCEHHLLPFTGVAHIAYIPNEETGRIVGLSKLIRLTDAYAQRLQVQERMTSQIADALVEHVAAEGVAVITEASHSCCELRGPRKRGAVTVVSALRGAMKNDPPTRAEVLSLIGRK